MRHKFFIPLLLTALCSVSFFSSCDDDEDDTEALKNLGDPRIRKMVLNNISSTFIVNDVEEIIYNYDSLDLGTKLTNVYTTFYGYTSQPTFKIKKEGEWVDFKNGSPLNLDQQVEILSTSEDKSEQKKYVIDLRVHNYDVSSITWNEYGEIDLQGKISSQKSFTHNGKNLWFVTDQTGASNLFSSSDLKNWEKRSIELTNADWSSSAILGDSIFVQNTEGKLFAARIDDLKFSDYPTSVKLDKILFTIGNNIWAISDNGKSLSMKNKGEFRNVQTLPDGFPTENMVSFTSSSGYTSLGYLFATKDGNGTIWSIDTKGNTRNLQAADGTIPYLKDPIVFQYSEMLGIIGGLKADGTSSSKCYSSKNSGAQWIQDWHKDMKGGIEGLSNAGTFILSSQGEIILVGGNTSDNVSKMIWKGVLNKLTADDLNYQN